MTAKEKRYEENTDLEKFIKETWQEERAKGKTITAFQLIQRVKTLYADKNIVLPKKRKMQMLIAEARKVYDDLVPKLKKNIESTSKPWSFGSLPDYPIPHEALPVVMKVARLCRVSDRPFTIRHALWTARLSTAISDTSKLAHLANVYTSRELVCLINGHPLYTSDLDTMWSMSPWELATAYLTGEAAFLHRDYFVKSQEREEFYPMPEFIGCGAIEVDMSYLHLLTAVLEYNFLKGSEIHAIEEAKVKLRQPIWQLSLSYTAERVYGMWLTYMSKGAKANELSRSERLELLLKLREWVRNHKLVKEPNYKLGSVGTLSDWLPFTIGMPISEIVEDFDLAPIDLLQAVGYSPKWERFTAKTKRIGRGESNEHQKVKQQS